MNKVFNTSLETSLRVALLLETAEIPMSLDEVCTTDFVATYIGKYIAGKKNLNGDNRFMYSEYAARRELCELSLKELVLRGIVKPLALEKGFAYTLTGNGKRFSAELASSYAIEYRKMANFACEYVAEYGADDVIFDITKNASEELR